MLASICLGSQKPTKHSKQVDTDPPFNWKEKIEAAEKRAEAAEKKNSTLEGLLEKALGRIKQLEDALYAKKSEKGKDKKTKNSSQNKSGSSSVKGSSGKKKSGEKRPNRRNHDHLPLEEASVDLPEQDKLCGICGTSFKDFPDLEDSETIEIEVKAHRRKVRRKRYMRQCNCEPDKGKVVVTPTPGKVVPKGKLGVSVWVKLLIGKFLSHQPIERQLKEFELIGLSIAGATVSDGFKKIFTYLEPVYNAIAEQNQSQEHWHVDESRWMVAEKVEGKESTKWWIWIFKTCDTVYFKLSKSRSAEVLKEHLDGIDGVVSCDRYCAYEKFARESSGNIDLAYCWAHARRDFISVEKKHKNFSGWVEEKLEAIGYLYHLHHIRRDLFRLEGSTSKSFEVMDEVFKDAMFSFKKLCEEEFQKIPLDDLRSLPLENIDIYWQGLSMVVANPLLDMDNNSAERGLRGPVVGRKNYWGNISEWSAHFSMVMFTLFQTLLLWGINPRIWLTDYLSSCSKTGGAPLSLDDFLPWSSSVEDQEKWSEGAPSPLAPDKQDSS